MNGTMTSLAASPSPSSRRYSYIRTPEVPLQVPPRPRPQPHARMQLLVAAEQQSSYVCNRPGACIDWIQRAAQRAQWHVAGYMLHRLVRTGTACGAARAVTCGWLHRRVWTTAAAAAVYQYIHVYRVTRLQCNVTPPLFHYSPGLRREEDYKLFRQKGAKLQIGVTTKCTTLKPVSLYFIN